MKSIVLAELAGSAGYGGGERYLELLYDRLDRQKFRCVLICPEDGPFVQRMLQRGADVRMISVAPLFNPFALRRLVGILRSEGVDILQTHGARANFYGRLAGWVAGVPRIVSTVHNSIKDYEVNRFKRWIYASALRLTLPLVHRIVCVSEAIRRDLLKECPPAADRTRTVHNGIDLNTFDPRTNGENVRKEYACTNGPVVLTIARLTEQKGHRYLLEALPNLVKKWPALTCLLVGDGECRASLQALAQQLGIEEACRFVGTKDNVADFYAAADVVVLPSLSEGFPFVVLESLAMARPTVATCVNGVPEIIEDGVTGLLVPSRDAQALETAIRLILHDPAWAAQLGQAGRARVTARFTIDHMLKETVAALEGDMIPKPSVMECSKKEAA